LRWAAGCGCGSGARPRPGAAGRADPGSARLSLPSLRWQAGTVALWQRDGSDRRVATLRRSGRAGAAPGAAAAASRDETGISPGVSARTPARRKHRLFRYASLGRTLWHRPGCGADRGWARSPYEADARRLLPVVRLIAAWPVSVRPLTTSVPQRCRGGSINATTVPLPWLTIRGRWGSKGRWGD
jgi:hypothetical protein